MDNKEVIVLVIFFVLFFVVSLATVQGTIVGCRGRCSHSYGRCCRSWQDSLFLYPNIKINSYMFENPEVKNSTGLSAWVENAYISGWGYEENAVGKLRESDRIRCADNDGIILEYLKYDCTVKSIQRYF